MSLSGQLFYQLWHRPMARIRDSLTNGGPWQEHRTERGRLEMENQAAHLPVLPITTGPALNLHLLTGRRFWYQTAFCLWTLGHQTGRPLAPVIYDDGSLTDEFRGPLLRLFPSAHFVSRSETVARLDKILPVAKYPALRERWLNYPNIRKLIDPHLGSTGWKLVLDSDLLFFHRPQFLVDWIDHPTRPLHAVDCETSYGYSRPLMYELAGAQVRDLVNVGLTGLNSSEIEWERLESWCQILINREQTNYYLEQALVAMLVAGRECAIAPADEYVTLPVEPEATACRAVMHHYVAHSKRWYFQHNWRRAMSS